MKPDISIHNTIYVGLNEDKASYANELEMTMTEIEKLEKLIKKKSVKFTI